MAGASTRNRLARLTSMDRHEIFDRLRQYATARFDVLQYGSSDDGSREAPVDLTGPEGKFFFTAAEVPSLCAKLKQVFPSQADAIVARAEKICRHRFDLLGYEDLDYGVEIDWHCDVVHAKRGARKPWFRVKYLDFEEVGDAKVTWELNRHQHFVTLAKAYVLTGNDKFAREVFAQWTHWRKENPYPIGINWASSLEVAFRSLSWVWTFFLLRESPFFTSEMRRQWLVALDLSGRHVETYLSTYFSPNTHLLGEALALFFLGTLFPSLRSDAARWQRIGWEILEREAAKQVREDGFYFEQSTYYHVYALDMFLHARILAGVNGITISSRFDQTLERMLNSLLLLGRDEGPPMIGDDDGGRLFDPRRNRAEDMLDPLAAGAILYRRGDFKSVVAGPREETLWLLGTSGLAEFDALPSIKPPAAAAAFPDSGLYLMADEQSGQQLLINAGPSGPDKPGHAHADALSICLVRSGCVLLIDAGTFEYVGDSGERARLRGVGAHNTMRVDGRDQADAAGPFAWANFPHVRIEQWITGQQFDLFQGSHDGYSRLSSPVIHSRWVFHKKGKFWMVRDRATGHGAHQLDVAWHLGPALSVASITENQFSGEGACLALMTESGQGWAQNVRRENWSPAYGRSEPATVVTFSATAELPADLVTLIITDEQSQADLGHLVKSSRSTRETVCAHRYSNPREEHLFFFACGREPWASGAWASDADFLYYSFDREKEQCTLILCNGSYADIDGNRVLSCDRRVRYAEVSSAAEKTELFSSDLQHIRMQHPLDRGWVDIDLIVPGNDPKGMGV